MSDRTGAELREAVADLTAHPLDPRPLGLMTKAAARIEELEALLLDVMADADAFLNVETGHLATEDGTVVYRDGFLMEIDPAVWRKAMAWRDAQRDSDHE